MFKENKFVFKKKRFSKPAPLSGVTFSLFGEILREPELDLISFGENMSKDIIKASTEVADEVGKMMTTEQAVQVASLKIKIGTATTPQEVAEALRVDVPKIIQILRSEQNNDVNVNDGLAPYISYAKEIGIIDTDTKKIYPYNKADFESFIVAFKSALKKWFDFIYTEKPKPEDASDYYPVVINDCGFDPEQKGDILIWVKKNLEK